MKVARGDVDLILVAGLPGGGAATVTACGQVDGEAAVEIQQFVATQELAMAGGETAQAILNRLETAGKGGVADLFIGLLQPVLERLSLAEQCCSCGSLKGLLGSWLENLREDSLSHQCRTRHKSERGQHSSGTYWATDALAVEISPELGRVAWTLTLDVLNALAVSLSTRPPDRKVGTKLRKCSHLLASIVECTTWCDIANRSARCSPCCCGLMGRLRVMVEGPTPPPLR